MCWVVALLMWIGIWTKLRIYRVPTDLVKWSFRGFGYMWRSFIMMWMLIPKKEISISHRKQVKYPSYVRLETSLVNFECHPCGIFEGLEQPQEVEAIDTTTF